MSRRTPWKAKNADKVTTKDGIPSLALSAPIPKPSAVPITRLTRNAAYQGNLWLFMRRTMDAPHTPDVKPAARSISPRRSTKTNPIAITMTGADWVIRFARFLLVKKYCDENLKIKPRAISPRIAGRAPISPDLTRAM